MLTFRATHFLGTQCLGESVIETIIGIPHSRAFFCCDCGEIWYRIAVEGGVWICEMSPCEQHKGQFCWDQLCVPGSILSTIPVGSPSYAAHLDFAPPDVLRREFDIHMKYFSKESV